jgi:hypothetical protein
MVAKSGAYPIVDGKVHASSCELNVAHHCNLVCRGCSHLSPWMKRTFIDPQSVYDDLVQLAKYYRPTRVTLLGGEPLLHPVLHEVAAAVRASHITDYVTVTTNGTLLGRMSDQFWSAVDEVRVSIYPGKELTAETYRRAAETARQHGVVFKVRHYARFAEPFSATGTGDATLTRRIYRTCLIAHLWQCNTVDNGYFYKCPPSLFIPKLLHADDVESIRRDGLRIADTPDFGKRLHAYLNSPEPLQACTNCLGTAGKTFAHTQQSRHELAEQRPSKDLIDWTYLRVEERAPVVGHFLYQLRTGIGARDILTYVSSVAAIRSFVRLRRILPGHATHETY